MKRYVFMTLIGCLLGIETISGQRIVCTSPHDLTVAVRVRSLSVNSAGGPNTIDVAFSTDGTRMYVLENGLGIDVFEYGLSEPYHLSTARFSGRSFRFPANQSRPLGFFLSSDGRYMFMVRQSSDSVVQYELSTPWNISTASFIASFSVGVQRAPVDVAFSTDGTRMFTVSSQIVSAYSLSTAWNITTASFENISFSVSEFQDTLAFSPDGTRMFVAGNSSRTARQYNLSIPWNLSTATFDSVSLPISGGNGFRGLAFSTVGDKMFVSSDGDNQVHEYELRPNFENYMEATNNEGTIMANTDPFTFVISGGAFLDTDGDDILDGGFTVANLPLGLVPRFTLSQGDTVATLEFNGSATVHDDANNVADLGVALDASAATGGTATVSCTVTLGLTFLANVPINFMRHGKRFQNGTEGPMSF